LEHGKFWEYALIGELLRSKLQILKDECDHFDELLKATPRRRFIGANFLSWISSETTALSTPLTKLTTCIKKELVASLGEPGVSGDAITMLNTVNALFGYCRQFLMFELAVCVADSPSGFQNLKTAFRGITLDVVGFVENLTDQWTRNVEGLRTGSREFPINLSINLPQLQNALKEIDRIGKHPENFK
jgi:hypothetical protein